MRKTALLGIALVLAVLTLTDGVGVAHGNARIINNTLIINDPDDVAIGQAKFTTAPETHSGRRACIVVSMWRRDDGSSQPFNHINSVSGCSAFGAASSPLVANPIPCADSKEAIATAEGTIQGPEGSSHEVDWQSAIKDC